MRLRGRRWSRPAGVAAVALLHVALAWVLLTYSRQAAEKPQAIALHEVFFYFLPHPLPQKRQHNTKPAQSARAPRLSTAPALPDYRGITIPDSHALQTLGLGRSVFGCSPQELADLPPQERARCANVFPPDASVDYRDDTGRARDAALWERGRQRKNAPFLLPCMNPQGAPNPLAVAACLAQAALDGGFNPDEQSSYADTQEITHLPNNGDPPDKPTYGP